MYRLNKMYKGVLDKKLKLFRNTVAIKKMTGGGPVWITSNLHWGGMTGGKEPNDPAL